MPNRSQRSARVGRNDDCPCGSGRKYKHCCERKSTRASTGSRLLLVLVIAVAVAGLVLAVANRSDETVRPGQVWSAEHGHYHDQ